MAVKCAVENHANLSSADLHSADLHSADLSAVDLHYANLRYANLSSANLSSADLRYTNLRYSDLSAANLNHADLSAVDLVVILLPTWTVYVQSEYTRIGCKYFKNSEWLSFTNEEIAGMDTGALEWWNKYKPIIETTIKSLN